MDDEAIAAGQNMLLTFGNVRNEVGRGNDIFSQATVAASDMAAAFGGDATSNSKILGKALNDPITGVSALTRVGVSFTQQQKDQIGAMQESGNIIGAQKIILGELTKQTGGAAEASATAGDKFKVAFDNLKESVGKAILPLVDKVLVGLTAFAGYISKNVGPAISSIKGFIGPVVSAVKGFFDSLGGGGSSSQIASLRDTFSSVFGSIKNIVKSAVDIVTSLWDRFGGDITRVATTVFSTLGPIIKGAFRVIEGIFQVFAAALKGDWSGVWDGIKKIVSGAWDIIKNVIKAGWAITKGIFSAAGKAIVGLAKGAWNAIKAATSAAWNAIKGAVVRALVGLATSVAGKIAEVKAFVSRGWAVLKAATSVAWNAIKSAVANAWSAIKSTATAAVNAVKSAVTRAWSTIKSATSTAWNAIKSAISGPIQTAGNLVDTAVGNIKTALSNAWSSVQSLTSSAWEAVKNSIGEKINAAIALIQTIPGRATAALGNLGSTLYNSGAALVQGLIDGISSRIAALGAKMSELASKVRGFLPGSPVKEGPLTSWNNGGAGKRLVGLLADGLSDTSPVDAAMSRLSSRVNLSAPSLRSAAFAGAGALGLAADGSGGALVNIEHLHTTDANGAAYAIRVEQSKALAMARLA